MRGPGVPAAHHSSAVCSSGDLKHSQHWSSNMRLKDAGVFRPSDQRRDLLRTCPWAASAFHPTSPAGFLWRYLTPATQVHHCVLFFPYVCLFFFQIHTASCPQITPASVQRDITATWLCRKLRRLHCDGSGASSTVYWHHGNILIYFNWLWMTGAIWAVRICWVFRAVCQFTKKHFFYYNSVQQKQGVLLYKKEKIHCCILLLWISQTFTV